MTCWPVVESTTGYSPSLTEEERNYAQIEKELPAIVFGTERFENYVYGHKVTVEKFDIISNEVVKYRDRSKWQ